jgi:hypothetical protein
LSKHLFEAVKNWFCHLLTTSFDLCSISVSQFLTRIGFEWIDKRELHVKWLVFEYFYVKVSWIINLCVRIKPNIILELELLLALWRITSKASKLNVKPNTLIHLLCCGKYNHELVHIWIRKWVWQNHDKLQWFCKSYSFQASTKSRCHCDLVESTVIPNMQWKDLFASEMCMNIEARLKCRTRLCGNWYKDFLVLFMHFPLFSN